MEPANHPVQGSSQSCQFSQPHQALDCPTRALTEDQAMKPPSPISRGRAPQVSQATAADALVDQGKHRSPRRDSISAQVSGRLHPRSQQVPPRPGAEEAFLARQLRKRDFGSDSDGNDGRQSKRARLTRRNLTFFDEMTRKKGMSRQSARSEGTADTSTTQSKTISTTSSGFEVQATRNGILLSSNSRPPENIKDLVGHLNRSRESASPTESVYDDYVHTISKVANEATTSHETVPLLKGYRDRDYARAWNQSFTAYPKNVGFNNGLSTPQPDFVQGFRQLEFEPFPVGEELDAAVLYNDDQNSIALPHFAGEWKGPGNDMNQAALQSAYDGAALVYSRNEALAYMGKSDPVSHASVLTVTTDGKALNVFGHYAAPVAGGDKIKYHQYRLTSAHLDESYEDFKKGRKQLRNAQDYARDQSYQLRDTLQQDWKIRQQVSVNCALVPGIAPATTVDAAPPADGVPLSARIDSAEEEEAGYEVIERADQPTPATFLQPDQRVKPNEKSSPSSLRSPVFSSSGQKRKAMSPPSLQLSKAGKASGAGQVEDPTSSCFQAHPEGHVSQS